MLAVVIYILVVASQAEATILSTMTDIIFRSGKHLSTSANQTLAAVSVNSQNMALLESQPERDELLAKSDVDLPLVGGAAVLAENGPMGTVADLTEGVPPTDQISVYIVRPGDNLSTIAQMYGVSVNTIRWANDLTKNSVIKEGQTLVILPITGIRYTVKKGDTLAGIIKKYGGDLDEIILYNDLEIEKGLTIGQIIIIPDGDYGVPVAKSPAAGTSSGGKYKGPSYPGYFMRPITGGVRTQGLHGNNAVDLAAPYGTPIYAAASGQVILARPTGYNGGYGGYLVISHPNGTQTLYSHCSSLAVISGQRVERGDVVGYIGSTGRSTGNHLHFEVRGAVNPF
ncbi:MAG: M23 family metallopeptidase [Candidatus Paceibacterota bacterium]|jgi:LysM repeat protein